MMQETDRKKARRNTVHEMEWGAENEKGASWESGSCHSYSECCFCKKK